MCLFLYAEHFFRSLGITNPKVFSVILMPSLIPQENVSSILMQCDCLVKFSLLKEIK